MAFAGFAYPEAVDANLWRRRVFGACVHDGTLWLYRDHEVFRHSCCTSEAERAFSEVPGWSHLSTNSILRVSRVGVGNYCVTDVVPSQGFRRDVRLRTNGDLDTYIALLEHAAIGGIGGGPARQGRVRFLNGANLLGGRSRNARSNVLYSGLLRWLWPRIQERNRYYCWIGGPLLIVGGAFLLLRLARRPAR